MMKLIECCNSYGIYQYNDGTVITIALHMLDRSIEKHNSVTDAYMWCLP